MPFIADARDGANPRQTRERKAGRDAAKARDKARAREVEMPGQLPDYRGSPPLSMTMPPIFLPRLTRAQFGQDSFGRDRAAPKDDIGDDHAAISPPAGRWPRVFPGL
jgi:hypothetical protein